MDSPAESGSLPAPGNFSVRLLSCQRLFGGGGGAMSPPSTRPVAPGAAEETAPRRRPEGSGGDGTVRRTGGHTRRRIARSQRPRLNCIITIVRPLAARFIVVIALVTAVKLPAQEPSWLSAKRSNGQLELSWPATIQKPDGSVVRPYFELQRTLDLQRWEPIGERQRALTTTPGQSLSATQPLDDSRAFYRLLSLEPAGLAELGSGGAEVFGYGKA